MFKLWKNLKISKKLFFGYGLILLVFLLSVYVTWYYIRIVEAKSNYLANEVMQSLDMATAFYREANGVFLTTRDLQYTESEEAVAAYMDQLTNAEKVKNEIIELSRKYPELRAPAHVINVVAPLTVEYVLTVNRAIDLIEEKKTMLNLLTETGSSTSKAFGEILTKLHNNIKSSIQMLNSRIQPTYTYELLEAMDLSARLLEKTASIRRDVWQSITVANAGGSTDGMLEIVDKAKDLHKEAENLKPYFTNSEEREIFDSALSLLENYEQTLINLRKICEELEQAYKDRYPIMLSCVEECRVATDFAVADVKDISKENTEDLSLAINIMLSATVASLVLGFFVAMLIARSISKPLNTIVSMSKRIGDGDMTIKKADFGYNGSDEMGSLVAALAEMVNAQNAAMMHIVNLAKSLAEGASDLSAISEETNAAMEEIRASVSQVSALSESNGSALEESNAGVEEMSSGADTVANSATDSADFILQTTKVSNKAINTVRGVIEGMRNVDKNARESEEKTRQLVSSVENVSSFVSVITGIADQTNLLALNAAIEAARAGEVGRGFAVVAEEVRKLAEESARAANSVNGIIQELQTGAQESIKVTTEAGRTLSLTLEHAGEALDELNDTMEQIQKANDSIQNIAAIAEEQAASCREVAMAIDNATKSSVEMVGTVTGIHRATDEAALATEGVAKQAEAMTSYSKELYDLLSKFKLDSSKPTNVKMLGAR
ncbi:MAG: methyl-accepting chemotaxis protein [Synergistaceae bacterium]|nr:methyl-accepting chemotaxis protein [Synergistaceae bacterium]